MGLKKFRIYSGKPKYISRAEIQGSWEREKQEKPRNEDWRESKEVPQHYTKR